MAGEIHKWVDEQGRTHFGDRPPAGEKATQVELRNPGTGVPARASSNGKRSTGSGEGTGVDRNVADKQQRLLRSLERSREERERDVARKKAERLARREKCEHARSEVERLKNARALVREKDDGTKEYLSELERASYEKRARERAQSFCS